MRRPDDNFLRDLLKDESLLRAREAALSRGLQVLRRRRRLRTFVTGAGTALAMAVLLALGAWQRPAAQTDAPSSAVAPAPATAFPQAPSPTLTFIDDSELLALFPDRSIALVGAPGEQQLLFLDQPERTDATR